MANFFLYGVLLAFLAGKVFAQNRAMPFPTAIEILEDKTQQLTLPAILKNGGKFQPLQGKVLQRPTSQSAYWLKLQIQNPTSEDAWIELGSSFLWYVDYYVPTQNGYRLACQTGSLRPYSQRAYPNSLFWLPVPSSQTEITVYVRIATEMVVELPIQVQTLQALRTQKQLYDFLAAGSTGLLLCLLGYNFFLFLMVRQRIYMWYVATIFTTIPNLLFINNYVFFDGFFSEDVKIYLYHHQILWQNTMYFFSGYFAIHFLSLREKSVLLYRYLKYLIHVAVFGLFVVCILDFFPYYFLAKINRNILLLFYFSLFAIGIYVWIGKRDKKAMFYVLGWSGVIVSVWTYTLVINGVIPYHTFTRNSIFFGVVWEGIFFSVALADKLQKVHTESALVRLEHLKIMQKQRRILKKKVKKRIAQIAQQKDEILAQHKVLESVHEQLLTLDQFKQNLISMVAHDMKNPLNGLLHIHAESSTECYAQVQYYTQQMQNLVLNMLDVQKFEEATFVLQKNKIHLETLLEMSIDQVAFLINQKNIQIDIQAHADIELLADDNILKRVITNLLLNMLKHSDFNQPIHITIEARERLAYLSMHDEALIIPPDKLNVIFEKFIQFDLKQAVGVRSMGLGLTFCKLAVEAHEGNIGITSSPEEGTKFWFSLPAASVGKVDIGQKKINEHTDALLSSEDKAILQPYLTTFKSLEVYFKSDLERLLQSINFHTENLKMWEKKLREAIFASNQALYEELLNI